MKLQCAKPGCSSEFVDDEAHRALTRLRARRAGWGYQAQVNLKTAKMRGFDYCPNHWTPTE